MASRTPLYDSHRAAGARFIEFAGWDMPLQYTGIVEEHLLVRKAVGLFDVSHMGKIFIEGPAAHEFVNFFSANDIPSTPGRARYTHLLRDDGSDIAVEIHAVDIGNGQYEAVVRDIIAAPLELRERVKLAIQPANAKQIPGRPGGEQ